jgi:hypothetical protein
MLLSEVRRIGYDRWEGPAAVATVRGNSGALFKVFPARDFNTWAVGWTV